MSKEYFEFHNPVKILSGKKAVTSLSYEIKMLKAKKPLIITDKGVISAGLIQKVIDSFSNTDIELAGVFDDVPQDSSVEVVNTIAKLYREKQCDSIVAVGGGSVLDTAKGVNIIVSENATDLMEFVGIEILKNTLKPLIAIPTTAGTGSEVTSAAVISNPAKNVKMSFTSPFIYPNVAILDPEMTLTLPPKLTAATGMDALVHAIEAYTCLQKNPISDGYALISTKLIMENIIKATTSGKDWDIRFSMLNGATLAGISFSNSLVGGVHAIAHALGGVTHLPHGIANSIMLPFVMEFNVNRSANLYAELYRYVYPSDNFSTNIDGANKLINKIKEISKKLNEACGLPLTLKDAGISKDKFEEVAKTAMNDGAVVLNPEKIVYEDVVTLLNKAYE